MREVNKFMQLWRKWLREHYLNFGIFNVILVLLVLLRSAGYFHPYFPISVNFIVMFMLFASVFLLNVNSTTVFVIFIVFWIFASILKMLNIDIWSERTGVYAFQALFLACLLLIFEILRSRKL